MKIIFIVFIFLLQFLYITEIQSETCDYENMKGDEFEFKSFSENTINFNGNPYEKWKKEKNTYAEGISYQSYKGKMGKLNPKTEWDWNGRYTWYEATLKDNCEKIYTFDELTGIITEAEKEEQKKQKQEIKERISAYNHCSENDVKDIIGKTIYIGQGWNLAKLLITKSGQKFFLKPFEPVKVINLTRVTPHEKILWSESYYLEVERVNGEKGWYPCQNDLIEYTSPISNKWPAEIIHLIKAQKLAIGMTTEQVLISWGKPLKINSNRSRYSVTEQWIYEPGRSTNWYGPSGYLYFENGELTNIQTSR